MRRFRYTVIPDFRNRILHSSQYPYPEKRHGLPSKIRFAPGGSSTIVQVAGECADPLGIKLFDPVFRFLEVSTSLFTPFFDKLAGNESLRQLIFSGWNEADIRKTWEADLQQYKSIRSKYLLYPD